jgi:hypothetical protein
MCRDPSPPKKQGQLTNHPAVVLLSLRAVVGPTMQPTFHNLFGKTSGGVANTAQISVECKERQRLAPVFTTGRTLLCQELNDQTTKDGA